MLMEIVTDIEIVVTFQVTIISYFGTNADEWSLMVWQNITVFLFSYIRPRVKTYPQNENFYDP